MFRMAQHKAKDGQVGMEECCGWLEWHSRQHRMVRMAQRKTVDGRVGTDDSSGLWVWHRGQQSMLEIGKRTVGDGDDYTADREDGTEGSIVMMVMMVQSPQRMVGMAKRTP